MEISASVDIPVIDAERLQRHCPANRDLEHRWRGTAWSELEPLRYHHRAYLRTGLTGIALFSKYAIRRVRVRPARVSRLSTGYRTSASRLSPGPPSRSFRLSPCAVRHVPKVIQTAPN